MTVNLERPQKNIQSQINDNSRKSGRVSNQLSQFDDLHQAQQFLGIAPRNFIINPSGSVAQRGTTGTKTGNSYGGYLSVDRWAVYYAGTILSQESAEEVNGILDNFIRCKAGSTGGRIYMYQKIENGSAFFGGGAPFSVSFWARGNAGYELSLGTRYYDNAATGGEAVKTQYDSIEITEGWKYYEFNGLNHVDASRNATRDFGLWLVRKDNADTASNEDYLDVTQVQLQLGPSVSPFIPRDKEQELALCQRYFQRFQANSGGTMLLIPSINGGTSNARMGVPLAKPMRTNPTLAASSTSAISVRNRGSFTQYASSGIGLGSEQMTPNPWLIGLSVSVTGMTSAEINIPYLTANSYLDFSAELS